jgi:hypothetical protein
MMTQLTANKHISLTTHPICHHPHSLLPNSALFTIPTPLQGTPLSHTLPPQSKAPRQLNALLMYLQPRSDNTKHRKPSFTSQLLPPCHIKHMTLPYVPLINTPFPSDTPLKPLRTQRHHLLKPPSRNIPKQYPYITGQAHKHTQNTSHLAPIPTNTIDVLEFTFHMHPPPPILALQTLDLTKTPNIVIANIKTWNTPLLPPTPNNIALTHTHA